MAILKEGKIQRRGEKREKERSNIGNIGIGNHQIDLNRKTLCFSKKSCPISTVYWPFEDKTSWTYEIQMLIRITMSNKYVREGALSFLLRSASSTIVLMLDGSSEICTHVRSNLYYLIYLRHLIGSRAVDNRIFVSEKTYFPSSVRDMF